MAHVQIKVPADNGDAVSIIIDGVEMNRHILAEGFAVNFGKNPEDEVSVSMRMAATPLEIDLPEAVIVALRASDEDA